MKKLISLLFLLMCVSVMANINVTFTLSDFSINPITNRTVIVQPMSLPTVGSGSVVIGNPITYVTDSNGQFTMTNAQTNVLYQARVTAPPSQTVFKVYFPYGMTDTNGYNFLVADSTATFPAGTVAWSAAVTDLRYAPLGVAGAAFNSSQFNTNSQNFVQVKPGALLTNMFFYDNGNNQFWFTNNGFFGNPTSTIGNVLGIWQAAYIDHIFLSGNSPQSGQFLKFTDTSGTTIPATITTSDVSGLGTMASINSPVPIANGGTAATTAQNAAKNVGVYPVNNNAIPTDTGSYARQFGISANGYFFWWDGSAWQSYANFVGGFTQIGHPYLMPSGHTPIDYYIAGNPNEQTAAHSSDDNQVNYISMNPYSSGSGISVAWLTTNAAGNSVISTNSLGIPIYLRDIHASSYVMTPSQAPVPDLPGYSQIVSDGEAPFALTVVSTVGGSNGNYSSFQFDPSSKATYFAKWVAGKYKHSDSGWISAMVIDHNGGGVTIPTLTSDNVSVNQGLTADSIIAASGIQDFGPSPNTMAVWINNTLSNAPSIADGQVYVADMATPGGMKATNFPSSGGASTNQFISTLGGLGTNTFFTSSAGGVIPVVINGLGATQSQPLIVMSNNSASKFSVGFGGNVTNAGTMTVGSTLSVSSTADFANTLATISSAGHFVTTAASGGANNSFIGGAASNTGESGTDNIAIVGGTQNTIGGNGDNNGIFAGVKNTIVPAGTINFSSQDAFIGGGNSNFIGTNSTYAVILGGETNVISTNGNWSAILSGRSNVVGGNISVAMGWGSDADHSNSFVWNDQPTRFSTSGTNQFLIHSLGGVGINTNNPGSFSLSIGERGVNIAAGLQGNTITINGNNPGKTNVPDWDDVTNIVLALTTPAANKVDVTNGYTQGLTNTSYVRQTVGTLSLSSSTNAIIDFGLTDEESVTLTGNLNIYQTTNRVAGFRGTKIIDIYPNGSDRIITLTNANWYMTNNIGGTSRTFTLTNGWEGMLSVKCIGASETNVTAIFTVFHQ